MKNGWQRKQIGDLCEVIAGQSPEGKFYNAEGEGLPFYQGKKDFGEKFIKAPTTWTTHTTKVAKEGDILISVRAPVGPVNFATEEVCIGRGLSAIRGGTEVDRDFLFYQLLHLQPDIAGREGAVFASINKSEIEALPLVFVPLPEQRRLVGILDEAFDDIAIAKANAKKNFQNARALFENHLQSVFTQRGKGWVDTSIGKVIRFIDYRGKTPVKTASGLRLITAKNVKMGYLQETPMEFIAAASYKAWMTRGIPQKGDVLFTTEAPLANVAQLDTEDKVAFAQRIIIMQPDAAKLDSTFLKYLLLSQPVQQLIRTKGTGATVQGIKASLLKTIEISFPKFLAEQQQIVAKLDDLSKESKDLQSIYRRKLAALDELKKSLLHQAFAGELTAHPPESVVIPFPTRISNITTTDLHAGILAIAYQLHERHAKENYFGHVKAEKVSHMVEAHLGIDLGRNPVKDAAGPDDYPRLLRVEHRAKNAGFFLFRRTAGSGYKLAKYRRFDFLIDKTRLALGDRNPDVDALLRLMLPMDKEQSEILATVYAAWNNLLIDRQPISDDAIVLEARENWHPDKLNIERDRFLEAIKWMKKRGVIPRGKGKKVVSRVRKKNA